MKDIKVKKTKAILDYFMKHLGEVTYWRKFQFRKKWYYVTFEYNVYEVTQC